MTELERLLIERACERLVLDSVAHNDQRDWKALAELYTVAGVVTRPDGTRIVGRVDIQAAYASGPADRVTRHLAAGTRVVVEDRETAHSTTIVAVVSGVRSDAPDAAFGIIPNDRQAVGELHDRFVLTIDGWRIAERRATIVMNI